MRAALIASVAALAVIGLSAPAKASPAAPQLAGIAAAATNVTPVRGGCGPGWHPQGWRDRWGYWHRRCVPNRW